MLSRIADNFRTRIPLPQLLLLDTALLSLSVLPSYLSVFGLFRLFLSFLLSPAVHERQRKDRLFFLFLSFLLHFRVLFFFSINLHGDGGAHNDSGRKISFVEVNLVVRVWIESRRREDGPSLP